MKIPPFIEARIKAVAALVVSAVVTYIATAVVSGTVWTAHGLEVAAATALLTAVGVHQAPKNKIR